MYTSFCFQVHKQSVLNELYVIIRLNRDQLPFSREQYLSEESDNSTPDSVLVFPEAEWRRLQTRTEELKAERTNHKNKFK